MLQGTSPLDRLLPLMRNKGVTLSAAEFHNVVNTTFHAFESEVYDDIHQGMRRSLNAQFHLLADDALRAGRDIPESLIAVDVGCGTGLSSEFLLRTQLGARISKLYLVDTSPQMLQRASERAGRWGVPFEIIEGTVDDVPVDRCDVVLMCSVLHHLPSLHDVFASVQGLQRRGGLFMHLQDPNGDYQQDPEFVARQKELRAATALRPVKGLRRLTPARITRRIQTYLSRPAAHDYITRANRALLERGVIERAMTADEMWHVTDLHVYDGGVSIRAMHQELRGYDALGLRSYGFFGELWSDVPASFREAEETLIRQHALNGRELAGVWQKRS